MHVNAAPMRHVICFSASASFHRYGSTLQSDDDEGGVGSGATGSTVASAVLLSRRNVLLYESYERVAAAAGGFSNLRLVLLPVLPMTLAVLHVVLWLWSLRDREQLMPGIHSTGLFRVTEVYCVQGWSFIVALNETQVDKPI